MTSALETLTVRERVTTEVSAWMRRRNVTGRDLAAAAGWSSTYLSRRLTGKTAFDLDDLEFLAAFLKVSIAQLLGDAATTVPPAPSGPISAATGPTGPARSRDTDLTTAGYLPSSSCRPELTVLVGGLPKRYPSVFGGNGSSPRSLRANGNRRVRRMAAARWGNCANAA